MDEELTELSARCVEEEKRMYNIIEFISTILSSSLIFPSEGQFQLIENL